MILLLLVALTMQACLFSTEPTNKNPRKSTWKTDTLFYPTSVQTQMSEILASSLKDIYAVGHCSNSLETSTI